ncbi:MAG: alanine--tRNA ligase [Candidatus Nealsonbacteria bacterium]|nr:alanine--tRNA ligase [Candidatus Nealsonbacteria bacterium]
MKADEIRKKFLDFFNERGHKIVPSSSLVPEDSSVLFTTAGMQQFTLYLQGVRDPLEDFGSRHLASCQKCFRTDDIEEVGDDTHHTFFEMLGNWSVGVDEEENYFKEGAIQYALDFFVKELGFEKEKLWVTVFKGEKGVPKDKRAFEIWKQQGIPEERIKEFGMGDNFWGPVSKTGPCGPCSEIFYDRGEDKGCGSQGCGPNCEQCNRFVELWNLVFMQYLKNEGGEYELLPQTNIDTGIGFERITAVLQKKPSAYETDLFSPIIEKLEEISGKKYQSQIELFRILADHGRGIVFLGAAGVLPSNEGRGYILRRLLRRVIRFGKLLDMPDDFLSVLLKEEISVYQDAYPELDSFESEILEVAKKEKEKFEETLEQGLEELHKIFEEFIDQKKAMEVGPSGDSSYKIWQKEEEKLGEKLFFVYQTYGFPLELSLEELRTYFAEEIPPASEETIREVFQREFERHQEVSRAGAEKKFGGIGKEATYEATKLHTATHLLQAALRQVLGEHVKQEGSDITPQRLRFDFSHPQPLTEKEIEKVEEMVNEKIKQDLPVEKEEFSYDEAIERGALAVFEKEKYPEKVSVYSVAGRSDESFSKELCAGPHVERTGELGHFKIIKEESSSAGVRRIKAVLE